MKEKMNWEKLDVHIENLVPGIVLLTVLILGWPTAIPVFANHEGLFAIAFVGVAYMLGAVGNVLARLLLDFVSEKTVRPYFLRFFAGDRLKVAHLSQSEINQRYSAIIATGLSCGNSKIEAEVAKRRQTGRLLRSALIPALLAIVVTGRHFSWSFRREILAIFAVYAALLLIYAYAEVAIFHEGCLGERVESKHRAGAV